MSLDSSAVPSPSAVSAVPLSKSDMSRDLGPWRFVVSRWKTLTLTFLLLVALSAWLTWPQVLHMSSVPDEGDPLLNTWALSWVAHQLPIAPARLVQANIFYPERYTLLYSESLILPGVLLAPLQWAGVHPVVVYNLALATGIVFSGLGLALLVLELTDDGVAAAIAAIAFAFLPFRMDHFAHMQLQQSQWIPMALWSLHRMVRSGRVADGVLLGVFSACQLLSCVYFGLMLFPFMAVVAVVIVGAYIRVRTTREELSASVSRQFVVSRLKSIAFAVVTFGVLAAPLGVAYVRASEIVGERGAGEAMIGSAVPSDYLAAPRINLLYGKATEKFGGPERRLFPGLTLVGLALVGLWRRRSAAVIAYLLALVIAADISFGLHGFTFNLLWEFVGVFRGLRVPARMGLFVGLALSVLAAYGVARIRASASQPWMRSVLPAIVAALLIFENRSEPIGGQPMTGQMPPAYEAILRDLSGAPTTAIADIPIAAAMPTYMYYSVFHWQNLLTGYSGFFPPSFLELTRSLEGFPDGISIDALRRRQARYVVVHGEVFTPAEYAAIVSRADTTPDLELVSTSAWKGAEMRVYRVLTAGTR